MAFTAKMADLIAEDKTGLLAKHESWARIRLSEVAGILNGAPFDSSKFNTNSGLPLARIRDVVDGRSTTFYSGLYSDDYLLNQGDLLIGMDGEFNTGYWGSQTALLNQRVCKITPNCEFYDKALLGYLLPGYLAAINANTPSITVKHLSSKTVGEIELPLPPRAEQTRIVEKLEQLLSDLDAGVAELKIARRKLMHYRQSLLKAAMEGALTADWRATYSRPQETGIKLLQRILSENRARWEQNQLAKFAKQGRSPPKNWQAKYPAPVASDITNLPPLPRDWTWASVEQLGDVQLGRQRSPDKLSGIGSTPYIRAANVTEAGVDLSDVLEMDFSDDERETFALKAGDVLLTEASGSAEHVGRPAIWSHHKGIYCFQNTVLRFRPAAISSEFAFCSFLAMQKTGVFSQLSGGVGINHLSAGKFSKLLVALPPPEEQDALVEMLNNALASYGQQAAAIETSLKQAAAQRKNLLKAAFAGQLVTQDPNDEHASELLARIRTARDTNAGNTTTRKRGRKVKENP